MNWSSLLTLFNFVFAAVIGVYFFGLLRNQQSSKVAITRESRQELDKLHQLRRVHLSEPLSEKTRPQSFKDMVGQQEGLQMLRAALCGPNPQHIIIYGPPGIGKTAAARLVLEEAKGNPDSPFTFRSKFVEIDATTVRFDERGIADLLIGSVHDPIYQGAGPMGVAGVPQPKPGAVTKAHGGILFLDEIGELHSIQMNKLLKVLEDRKVFFESAYYSSGDPSVPEHIHDIFQNGLPADFRLVGATTRMPQELPSAIRSRCVEIFFDELTPQEISQIADRACTKVGMQIEKESLQLFSQYAKNGREVVNMVQIAAGLAQIAGRQSLAVKDIEWVINSIHATPRLDKKIASEAQVGLVMGLATFGPNVATLVEVEVTTELQPKGTKGHITVTGVVEEEELGGMGRVVRRKSMARDSVENALTALAPFCRVDPGRFNIHINFPGGVPLDGPSAGITIASGIYSALEGVPINNKVAMTGEVSIRGYVRPVGAVTAKLKAAQRAGVTKVIIPKSNWQENYAELEGVSVVSVSTLAEVFEEALIQNPLKKVLSASSSD